MDPATIDKVVARVVAVAGLSRDALAARTRIAQPTLNQIISGERIPKTPAIVLLAQTTGHAVSQLTGTGAAARVRYAARSTDGASTEMMRQQLLGFVELNSYLSGQAIPRG